MNKLIELWMKIITFKPQIIAGVEVIYKAIYILNSIIKFAIDAALPLGLDVSTIAKIGSYIEKIKVYVDIIADKLGISASKEFEADVRSLVTTQAKALPKAASKRAKLTLTDVVDSYSAAFEKLDDVLTK